MNTIEHIVALKSKSNFGRQAPPQPVGEIMRLLPETISRTLRMAFEGRSTASGTAPAWLNRMSDIRFVDYDGNEDTILKFSCPTVGAAAPELYGQREFPWSERPDENDTGFDLLGDVLADLATKNTDSQLFDGSLLRTLSRFKNGINGTFQEIELSGHRFTKRHPAVIDQTVINTAKAFSSDTPAPEPVRIVGMLDMVRASTQAFAIKLDDGQEVRGVMLNGEIGGLSHLLEKRVLVLGRAVFRPSGRLLRVDTEYVHPASADDEFFSRVPRASRRRLDVRQFVREQSNKRGVAAIIGKWPGDETDEQIEVALRELS
ncbi:MAG: hypothetical protein WD851_01155 [Pirellulales bacterium]